MGLVVEPRNPSALAAGIKAVLKDPARYARPRKEIQTIFDPSESVDRYEALMSHLVRRRP
jgi:hypothetical protein